jgi:hypothetical protein
MIYDQKEILEGYIILLNNNMKIPNINMDMSIKDYINKFMKMDKIRELSVERYDINGITYIIYYAIGNSKYYNSIFDNNITDYIWKDVYQLNNNIQNPNIYEVDDYKINVKELFDKYRNLLFNI